MKRALVVVVDSEERTCGRCAWAQELFRQCALFDEPLDLGEDRDEDGNLVSIATRVPACIEAERLGAK
jgi:hypothetical protein